MRRRFVFMYSFFKKMQCIFIFFCIFFPLYIASAEPIHADAVEFLTVQGAHLKTVSGQNIQLKGVSTHGLSWFPQYVNKAAFQSLKSWGCNTVRLALYPHEYNGYCTGGDQANLNAIIHRGITYAKELDMYVIIDWHVLNEHSPKRYKAQAKAFFQSLANKYKDCPNVIFEICNEPNGKTSWNSIKKYAVDIIGAIRSQGSQAVVIVGTPTWSQDVDIAAGHPITEYDNIVYALHFYANTHTDWLRTRAEAAINSGLPLFVSEFGICDASGNGTVNTSQANRWIRLLDKHNISYILWNLSNKNESSALIKSSCQKLSGWTNKQLTKSGKWYRKQLRSKKNYVGKKRKRVTGQKKSRGK